MGKGRKGEGERVLKGVWPTSRRRKRERWFGGVPFEKREKRGHVLVKRGTAEEAKLFFWCIGCFWKGEAGEEKGVEAGRAFEKNRTLG